MNNPCMVADTSLMFYLNSKDFRSYQSGATGWVDLRLRNRITGQLNNMSLVPSGGYLFFNGLTITGSGSSGSSGSGSFSFVVDNSGNFLINNSGDFIVSGSGSGGSSGGGVSSSGSASYVDISPISVNPNCSIMFWASSSNYKNVSGGAPLSWGSAQSSYSLLFTSGIALTGAQTVDFFTAPPSDTGWHNFILTFNSSQNSVKFYVDGLLAAGSPMVDVRMTSGTVRIGETVDGLFPFSGYLNGIAIYRRALGSGEVRRNFRATKMV